METTQDKKIREKLDSLDTLPEGYNPSLDSKWELLLAGQPKKKTRQPYFWYAAAASVVLLLTFGYLFWPAANNQIISTVAQQTAPAKKPVSAKPETMQTETEVAAIMPVTTSNIRAGAVKNGSKKQEKTRTIKASEEIITAVKNPEPAAEQTILTAQPEPELLASEAVKPAKKRKPKFVEMDFEAPVETKIPFQETQTAQVQFRLKLLPQTAETHPTLIQAEKPFRLQHTF